MSFLEHADPAAVVADALAFIDAFDESSSGSDDKSDARRSSFNDPEQGKFERAKARRKGALYSARLRAKKKSERAQLKEQVARLELQLQRLRRDGGSTSSSDSERSDRHAARRATGASSQWLEKAAEQALKRHEAEQLNAQMKTYLAQVLKTSATLQQTYQKLQTLRSEIGATLQPLTVLAGPSLRSNDATPQLGYLREYLETMRSEAQIVFASKRTAKTASFDLNTTHDPRSGGILGRIESYTPVECDMDTASRMVWNGMQLKGGLCCKEFVHRLHTNANAVAKSYFMNVSDQRSSCMLHGVSFVRKFEERDRILYMWASVIMPPQHDSNDSLRQSRLKPLRFFEKGWAMLARAPDNPDHGSVFQTNYEVLSKLEQSGAVNGEFDPGNNEYLCFQVVDMLTSSLRLFHHQVQSTLLEDVPRNQTQ